MPWDSYLCSVAGCVHLTHLHGDSDGSGRIQVAPVEVVLAVGDATCDGIASEELEMASKFEEDNLPMKKILSSQKQCYPGAAAHTLP